MDLARMGGETDIRKLRSSGVEIARHLRCSILRPGEVSTQWVKFQYWYMEQRWCRYFAIEDVMQHGEYRLEPQRVGSR